MFENLIGQDRVVSALTRDILDSALPSSILLYGESYSGKLTAALEIARALCCRTSHAAWNCNCRSCIMHRYLLSPELLLVGPRYFLQEIIATGEALKRDSRRAVRYLFLRAVRKLLRRFDSVLWEGDEKKIAGLASSFDSVNEALDALSPEADAPEQSDIEKAVASIVKESAKLAGIVPAQNIPVQTVRNIAYWARTAANTKVVVIENADKMQEGSRNALLKTLEEPPPSTHFVLTTTARSAIIPTILSRVRSYRFAERDETTSVEVLRRIYRESEPTVRSLRRYFVGSLFSQDIHAVARAFIEGVLASETDLQVPQRVLDAVEASAGRQAMRYFAEELYTLLSELLHAEIGKEERDATTEVVARWSQLVREHLGSVEGLNMSLPLVLESLYLKMRASS